MNDLNDLETEEPKVDYSDEEEPVINFIKCKIKNRKNYDFETKDNPL